jgi:hypothetical protein
VQGRGKHNEQAAVAQGYTFEFALQDTGPVKVYDPVLGASVEQRQFAPEDEKQAVLMEMYTESRLKKYVKEVEEVAATDSWHGNREPPVRLDHDVMKPMLVCAQPHLHAVAMRLRCLRAFITDAWDIEEMHLSYSCRPRQ